MDESQGAPKGEKDVRIKPHRREPWEPKQRTEPITSNKTGGRGLKTMKQFLLSSDDLWSLFGTEDREFRFNHFAQRRQE